MQLNNKNDRLQFLESSWAFLFWFVLNMQNELQLVTSSFWYLMVMPLLHSHYYACAPGLCLENSVKQWGMYFQLCCQSIVSRRMVLAGPGSCVTWCSTCGFSWKDLKTFNWVLRKCPVTGSFIYVSMTSAFYSCCCSFQCFFFFTFEKVDWKQDDWANPWEWLRLQLFIIVYSSDHFSDKEYICFSFLYIFVKCTHAYIHTDPRIFTLHVPLLVKYIYLT